MSPVLQITGLHAGYGTGDILKGVDLSVPAGEVVTIIGPNGSGKSTLLKTLAGLLRVRAGEMELNGRSLKQLSVSERVRSGLAYVPQEYNVFRNMTVLENLKIAHEFMAAREVPRKDVATNEVLELFPELPGKFGVRAGNLSGGQRQMLAFACALSVRPEILVLDEPSAGLSPRYMSDIFQAVRKVNAKGISVLMVEQNAVEALAISDKCVVMANGRVRMNTAARDILQMDDLHSLYLGSASEQTQ